MKLIAFSIVARLAVVLSISSDTGNIRLLRIDGCLNQLWLIVPKQWDVSNVIEGLRVGNLPASVDVFIHHRATVWSLRVTFDPRVGGLYYTSPA